MNYSRNYYNALEGQRDFDVTFPKLDRSHVRVQVNGEIRSDWSWFNDTRIRFDIGLNKDDVVLIERNTSQLQRIVDYEPPSSLNEKDLDDDSLQAFYMAQEALDKANSGVVDDPVTGLHTASNKRITNVADPVDDQDAATKKWAMSSMDSQVGQAASHAVTAKEHADTAEAARDTAEVYRDEAADSATQAEFFALAAGAPLFTSEPDLGSAPSPYLLLTDAGMQVWTHDGSSRTFAGWLGRVEFPTTADLIEWTAPLGPEGTEIVSGSHLYRVASPSAEDHHVQTEGGVKLYVVPQSGEICLSAFVKETGPESPDCTAQFQKAVDAQFELGVALKIDGRFNLDGTVSLPPIVTLRGMVDTHHSYTSSLDVYRKSEIRTLSANVFTASAADKRVRADITGIAFVNQVSRNAHPPEDDATLFHDVVLYSVNIVGNLFFGYGRFVYGSVLNTSYISNNAFTQVRYRCFDGDGGCSFVDGQISGNYFNGDPLKNATLANCRSINMMVFRDNFVDFFKVGFRLNVATSQWIVEGNRFDYIFRVLDANDIYGAVSGLVWSANIHRAVKKSIAIDSFPNADTDMENEPWTVIKAHGLSYVTISNNVTIGADLSIYSRGYPHAHFRTSGNVYSNVDTTVDYAFIRSGSPVDQSNVFIEELDGIRVEELPNPALTGSSSAIIRSSFDGQRIIYNNMPLFNDNGVWRDMMGGEVTYTE